MNWRLERPREGRVFLDFDRTNRRSHDALAVGENLHSETAPKPGHFQEASTETRAGKPALSRLGEKPPPLNQYIRLGWLEDDDPIERIFRADEKCGEGVQLRQTHTFSQRNLFGKAIEGASSWHESIVKSGGRSRDNSPDALHSTVAAQTVATVLQIVPATLVQRPSCPQLSAT